MPTGSSKPSVDGEGRKDEDKHVDQGPDKRYPSGHLKESGLVNCTESTWFISYFTCATCYLMIHLQSAYDTSGNQRFEPPDDDVDNGRDPYEFPISPLDCACPEGNDKMDSAEKEESPDGGEAPDVGRIVKVVPPSRA